MKSKAGFVLALIGGILTILFSILLIIFAIIYFFGTSLIGDIAETTGGTSTVSNTPMYLLIAGFFWLLIIGILAIVAGAKMNKDDDLSVKKGGIMALILGILSFNILTILGGILGIIAASNKSSQSMNVQVTSFKPTIPR